MRARAVVLSTLASAATLGAGAAAWAIPATQQAHALALAATATSTPSVSASATSSASASPTATPSASATPTPSASAQASASASASQSSSTAYNGYTGTLTGDAVSMRYGVVQVSVTLSSGTITEVTVLQAPSTGKDALYTNRCVPTLRSEALSTQSANIQAVSGATYTSDAYIQSLQSALDQA